MTKTSWEAIDQLLKELLLQQQERLLVTAQRIVPQVTAEDLWQPNDFNELEFNPHFRYEEGILSGIQTVQMALWALQKQST